MRGLIVRLFKMFGEKKKFIAFEKDQYIQIFIKMLAEYNATCQTAVESDTYDKIVFKISENPHPLTRKTTFDCGVQTNLNERDNPEMDLSGLEELMAKKRQKRKEYKRRKKMQKKMMQKENKEEFKQIIDLFYDREAKFVDYADRLQELVCSFNQSEFKNIFDSILKQRVVVCFRFTQMIQNSIWEYTQAILQENPLEMPHDHPFYLEMVDQIYRYYKLIEKSSLEAEQVIYIYLSLNSKESDEPITPQDLGRRTFRYLVETDQTLRKLIHMCDKKITMVRLNERQKLQIMISKLKNFRQRFQNNIFDDDQDPQAYYENDNYEGDSEQSQEAEEFEDQKSTAFSETSEDFEETQKNSMKKKRKKRVLQDFEEEEEKIYNYLENLTIDKENRLECNVPQEVCRLALAKVQNISKNFKKPTEFDLLMKKLDALEPMRRPSQQFKRLY